MSVGREGSFWRRLNDVERTALAEAGTSRPFRRGETLIESGRAAAVLLSGHVCVLTSGGTRVVANRRAGDIVGERHALDGRSRQLVVRAETAVRALLVECGALDRVLSRHPRVLRVLCVALCDHLSECGERLAAEAGDAFAKVVGFLLRSVGPGGHGHAFPVHITSQTALGQQLHVSRDSVNRALSRLRADGTITTHRGVVTVRDLAALRAHARR